MADSYGARIKAARKFAGLTQKELAGSIGCAEMTIRRYEASRRTVKLQTLEKIAGVCGCDVLDLIPHESKPMMPSNPYWERIEAIADRQRAKGMKTYGQGIEANPEALHKRIDMALEELIDLALYLCWVDDKIKELEDEVDD